MAWSVRLQDARGKPVSCEDALIETELISSNKGKLLAYVDPYSDTVFNGLQMADFLEEWKQLEPKSDIERQEWELVRQMAERCKDEPHLYLKFIGD